jgi:hypothetical protein
VCTGVDPAEITTQRLQLINISASTVIDVDLPADASRIKQGGGAGGSPGEQAARLTLPSFCLPPFSCKLGPGRTLYIREGLFEGVSISVGREDSILYNLALQLGNYAEEKLRPSTGFVGEVVSCAQAIAQQAPRDPDVIIRFANVLERIYDCKPLAKTLYGEHVSRAEEGAIAGAVHNQMRKGSWIDDLFEAASKVLRRRP